MPGPRSPNRGQRSVLVWPESLITHASLVLGPSARKNINFHVFVFTYGSFCGMPFWRNGSFCGMPFCRKDVGAPQPGPRATECSDSSDASDP